MTEQQVELAVERAMDALDRRLMDNSLTQAEYDAEVRKLSRWADRSVGLQRRVAEYR